MNPRTDGQLVGQTWGLALGSEGGRACGAEALPVGSALAPGTRVGIGVGVRQKPAHICFKGAVNESVARCGHNVPGGLSVSVTGSDTPSPRAPRDSFPALARSPRWHGAGMHRPVCPGARLLFPGDPDPSAGHLWLGAPTPHPSPVASRNLPQPHSGPGCLDPPPLPGPDSCEIRRDRCPRRPRRPGSLGFCQTERTPPIKSLHV